MDSKWTHRWNSWIAAKAALPGVFARKEGGFLVRGRVTDPRTGKSKEIRMSLPGADARAAYNRLHEEIERVKRGLSVTETPKVRFTEYAASLFERKLKAGKIKSAKSREKWEYMVRLHLDPAFGEIFIDAIRRRDLLDWMGQMADLIDAGDLHPGTANDRLQVMSTIMNAAVAEFELERNPMTGIERFDISEHPTYTDEDPNSLTPEQVPAFLATMKRLYPQHFAMTSIGFATGLRPSSLRPLRREGEKADVKWEENAIVVRRSQTIKSEVMETTKTRRRQKLFLPEELMSVLRWHIDTQIPEWVQAKSNLLFPSTIGGFRTRSVLDKPFAAVATELKLGKHISAKAMRRTYQDLARAAEVKDIVTRSVSGHATEKMQERYSTVAQAEMRSGIAKIISLAGVRAAMEAKEVGRAARRAPRGGMHGGMHGDEMKNGQSAL